MMFSSPEIPVPTIDGYSAKAFQMIWPGDGSLMDCFTFRVYQAGQCIVDSRDFEGGQYYKSLDDAAGACQRYLERNGLATVSTGDPKTFTHFL